MLSNLMYEIHDKACRAMATVGSLILVPSILVKSLQIIIKIHIQIWFTVYETSSSLQIDGSVQERRNSVR